MFCLMDVKLLNTLYGNADNALNKKSSDYQIKQLVEYIKRQCLLKMPQQEEVNCFALLLDLPQYRDNNSLLSILILRFFDLMEVSLCSCSCFKNALRSFSVCLLFSSVALCIAKLSCDSLWAQIQVLWHLSEDSKVCRFRGKMTIHS
jgi:hypothetical protein